MAHQFSSTTLLTRPRRVAVIGSCGGVGASTLATLLASSWETPPTPHTARRTWLIETRTHGNLEALLGLEQREGARWQQLNGTRGAVDTDALANATPQYAGAHVLMMDRFSTTQPEVLAQQEVLDSLVQQKHHLYIDASTQFLFDTSLPIDLLIVVSPLSLLGLNAVVSLQQKLAPSVGQLAIVGTGLRAMTLSSQQFQKATKIPVMGWFPRSSKLAQHIEFGVGPSAQPPHRAIRKLITALHSASERLPQS